jgi:predicted Fe-Mo cluster-binding NifX family protein
MTNSTLNNVTAIALSQKNQAGVTKYLTALPTLLLAGIVTTPTAINAVFQADIDTSTALEAAEADVAQKRAAQKAARAAAIAERSDLKAYIIGNHGEQAVQMLQDFGFDPPKPRGAQTVASKAQAVAQGKATRVARGTKGAKQKATIKGVVATPAAEPTATPVTPAATPATPAAPVTK